MKHITQQLFHALPVKDVWRVVQTTPQGLTPSVVVDRAKRYGKNVMPQEKAGSWGGMLWRQLNNPLVMIIASAAGISFYIGHRVDAFFIVIVIVINTLVGFLQEYKAHNALVALQKTITPTAQVLRAGKRMMIPSEDLVIGDVVLLSAGDQVPADGRLFFVEELYAKEAILTGEVIDIKKKVTPVDARAELSERTSMVYSGTHITHGTGKYIVTAIGAEAEIGKIAQLVRDEDETEEPLKKKFRTLSRRISIVVFLLIILFAVIGFFRGQTPGEIFLTATALVVSAIPEGLLPAVTIVMIFGVRRLAKKKALVRRLASTETIGAISVICTDKTGTLTTGQMRVAHILTGAQELFDYKGHVIRDGAAAHVRALEIAGVVNDAFIENPDDELEEWTVQGRPTDKALLLAAVQAGIDLKKYHTTLQRVAHLPFSSARKFSASVYAKKHARDAIVFMLGAPQKVLERTTSVYVGPETIVSLTPKKRKALEDDLATLTQKGLRVLACAQRTMPRHALKDATAGAYVQDMTFIGFIAIKDPIRHDVHTSLLRARQAGIRPIIITGDNAKTAAAVVAELSWHVPEKHIITGKDLEEMSETTLQRVVDTAEIFARVAPEHKIRIVHALQDRGEVVAMVGDGVNDAPALKAAHVGISMGNAADITKGVADIVLLDSSFTTIIDAIEQGRVIFDNIRRIIIYLLADDFSELFVFFVALLFGLPLPLVAAQILWINLVEDALPNIALTTERDTKGIMDRPPRPVDEPIITRRHKKFMFVIFLTSGIAAVGIFVGTLWMTGNVALAQTITFLLIALDSLAMVYVLRSFRRSIFRKDLFDNKAINGAIIISLLLLIFAVTFSPLMGLLHTVYVTPVFWLIIVAVTFFEVLIIEKAKHRFFISQ